jgi:pimeloyl-ACP methyl ester carboxylesterase
MNEAIETRELFVLDGSDVLIRGTYHKAYVDNSGAQPNWTAGDRLGVVFVNSTSPTRAANGDAAVYLAESLAKCGYPCFRLDLPGFGDSEGDHPADLLGVICRGGYASIASAKVEELVARYNLSGVVIAGHCAGSVSALFTAATSRGCRGLVLIGPFFHLTQPIGLSKIRKSLKLWALQSRLGECFSNVYEFLSEIPLVPRGRGLPRNANLPLLRCWKKLAPTGMPILFLKGPDRKNSITKSKGAGEFDYLSYLLRVAGRRNEVVVKVTDGASNAFANRQGRAAVRQHTERWLSTHFPLINHHESVESTSGSERDETRRHYKLRESYLSEQHFARKARIKTYERPI